MPISKYNKYLGNAEKTHSALKKRYGTKKGESVFYGLVNKRKKEQAYKSALKRRTNG